MILNEEVKITINPSNLKYYSKYYDNIKIKDILFVKVNELTKGSNTIIKVKCDECDFQKSILYKDYIRNGYKEGEWLCRMCKTKKTNLEKYGIEYTTQRDDVKKKSLETLNEKYNVDNISQLQETKDKIKETCIKKYNSETFLSSQYFKEKSKDTLLRKYNVTNISYLQKTKDKIKSTTYENYGVDNGFKTQICKDKNVEKVLNHINNKYKNHKFLYKDKGKITIFCNKCNDFYDISFNLHRYRTIENLEICTICNPLGSQYSNLEKQLQEFITQNYNRKIVLNNKSIISPYELDIYLPDLNIAFEFNGLYWHSELYKDKNYHQTKSNLCEDKGIYLFHVWEDSWKYDKNIKSRILNIINGNLSYKTNESEIIVCRDCLLELDLLFEGYKVIDVIGSDFKWIHKDKRVQYETGIKIWDSGYKKLRKVK